MENNVKYDAFISYRHSDLDMAMAKKVHKSLETFKVPGSVKRKTGKKRIQRVFRDQEELPIGSDLGHNIENALASSEWLIVICSPRLPESYWCLTEIETFIKMHDRNHVLAVLVEGEPDESFPKILLEDDAGNPIEPLAADVRGETKAERNKKFKTEIIRLCAPLLGVTYDDLRQRHRERAMKKYTAIAALFAVAGIAFGFYNAYNLAQINENYQAKLENQSKTLAVTSLDVLETGDRKTAALIALEGLPVNEDRPLVAESIDALSRALNTYSIGDVISYDHSLEHALTVKDLNIEEDGLTIVSYDQQDNVYFWDTSSGELLFSRHPDYYDGKPEKTVAVAAKKDSCFVLTDHSFREYNCDGSIKNQILFDEEMYAYGGISENIKYAYLTNNDRTSVIVLNIDSFEEISTIELPEEESIYGDSLLINENTGILAAQEKKDSERDKLFVCFYDVNSGENLSTVETEMGYGLCHTFTCDDYYAIDTIGENALLSNENSDCVVEKIDPRTGEKMWATTVLYMPQNTNFSYSTISSRKYQEEDAIYSEIFISCCGAIYGLNLETGQQFVTIKESANIEEFKLRTDNSLGFILTFDGKIDVADFTTGMIYADNQIKAFDGLALSFKLKNGILATRGYMSNEIVQMRYQTGKGIRDIASFDNSIDDIVLSPNNETFLVSNRLSGQDYFYEYNVYSTDKDELIAKWEVDEDNVYTDPVYIDDTHVAIFPFGSKILIFDVNTGQKTEFDMEPDQTRSLNRIACKDKVVAYSGKDYYVANMAEQSILFSGRSEDNYIADCIVNEAGDRIAMTDYSGMVYIADKDSIEPRQIGQDINLLAKVIAFNSAGNKLAIGCVDGILRIYDFESGEIVEAIDFYSDSTTLIQYSDDDNYIYLQGADFYFQIIDANTFERKLISDGQMNQISGISYDEQKNILAIKNSNYMYLIDCNSFGFMQTAPYGKLFLPNKNYIYSAKYKEIYKFQYQTYEDLIEEFNNQFPNAFLSDLQKLKYNID